MLSLFATLDIVFYEITVAILYNNGGDMSMLNTAQKIRGFLYTFTSTDSIETKIHYNSVIIFTHLFYLTV